MNITIVDMQPILPAISGGRIRLLGLYKDFSEQSKISYVGSYDWPGESKRITSITSSFSEILIPLSEQHFIENEKINAFINYENIMDLTFPQLFHYSEALIEETKKKIQEAEVVIFSHPWMFYAVQEVLDYDNQLIVYDAQNFEGILRTKLLGSSEKAYSLAKEVVKIEYELSHAADLILSCSEEDMGYFNEIYAVSKEKLFLAPNGVFSNDYTVSSKEQKVKLKKKLKFNQHTAIFVGSDYLPNIEAAMFIIEIASELKHITFIIIGGAGERLKDKELPNNVIITGFIDESLKNNYLAASDVALNPIISGSGTNIKMLEYMALGLPIVTTATGARGFQQLSDKAFLVATIEDFSQKLKQLLENDEKCKLLGQMAKQYADTKFNWKNISQEVELKIQQEFKKKKLNRSTPL